MVREVAHHDRLGWSPRLRVATGICSVVFAAGSALQTFVMVNLATLKRMMELAGRTHADAQAAAPAFLTGFRIVGCLYILGNALGTLALRGPARTWLFRVVLAVNVTQAAGVVMVPSEMFEAAVAEFGVLGAVPTVITDGGALILFLVLVSRLVAARAVMPAGGRS